VGAGSSGRMEGRNGKTCARFAVNYYLVVEFLVLLQRIEQISTELVLGATLPQEAARASGVSLADVWSQSPFAPIVPYQTLASWSRILYHIILRGAATHPRVNGRWLLAAAAVRAPRAVCGPSQVHPMVPALTPATRVRHTTATSAGRCGFVRVRAF